MGLDTTHGCWHGAYSAFSRWRMKLAEVAGVPLPLMEGYYRGVPAEALEWLAPRAGGPRCGHYLGPMLHGHLEEMLPFLPLSWDALKPDVLHELLNHSDTDGEIPADVCGPLADRLAELLPLLDGDGGGHIGSYREKTEIFIAGLRAAAAAGEPVEFY